MWGWQGVLIGSGLTLAYVFILYPVLLRLLLGRGRSSSQGDGLRSETPRVSVIVSALNEEQVIQRRIDNLLDLDYPRDRLQVLIASDGSTDRTVELVRHYDERRVRVLPFAATRGRAVVHNDAVAAATGEIVVFTDAATVFDRGCLEALVRPFADPGVGCVVGNLRYTASPAAMSRSEGFYWRYETWVRRLESDLGVLATGTGACMAVRTRLWRRLSPVDDVDFTTPLDVILAGYRVVVAPDARAQDMPPATALAELRSRIRQTSKNLLGTLRRWTWAAWVRHPLHSWGLLSHKILRWLTPFFLLAALCGAAALREAGSLYAYLAVAQAAFYGMAAIGLVGEILHRKIPLASLAFSFCVASVGMGIGVVVAIAGRAPATFKPSR